MQEVLLQQKLKKQNKHGRETRQKCCNCPMNITIGIRHSSHWKNRVYTDHDKFPLFVNLYFDHNHNHFSARSLSHNGITEQAESDIIQLFKRGMGPTQAYNDLRATIAEHAHTKSRPYGGRGIEAVLADSSICPTLRQVKYIFINTMKFNSEHIMVKNCGIGWRYLLPSTIHKMANRAVALPLGPL